MKVLIIGATGMLGHKLVQVLSESFDTVGTMRGRISDHPAYSVLSKHNIVENIDISDISAIRSVIQRESPAVVINAVGIIKQLSESKDVIKTLEVNSIFPHKLAEYAQTDEFRLITIGTDCVFLGSKGNYRESDPPDALDLYGRSKQLGEASGDRCLTLRTSIIGRELATSHSLIEWFLSQNNKNIKGFSRALFSGLPTIVLAEVVAMIIARFSNLSGLFHVSSDPISKFDLLNLVKQRSGVNIEIEEDVDFVIDRSLNSERFKNLTGYECPNWTELVDRMFTDSTPYSSY